MDKKLISIRYWLRLRKNTVVAHWLYGLFCALVSWQFFPGGLIFLYIFERLERWNDQCDGTTEGAMDWWDSFVVKIGAFAIILILHFVGILTIRWY